jgi:hypothetical protein
MAGGRADIQEACMHDRMPMIQRRETGCARDGGWLRRALHGPHGLGIAKTPIGHHVNGCRIVEIECRHRISQDHKMASGRGQRLEDRTTRVELHRQDIVKPGGATLVGVGGGDPRPNGIVASSMVLPVDVSPQMISRARDLAIMTPSAEKHPPARFRPAMAVSIRRSAEFGRTLPLRLGDAGLHRGV